MMQQEMTATHYRILRQASHEIDCLRLGHSVYSERIHITGLRIAGRMSWGSIPWCRQRLYRLGHDEALYRKLTTE